MVQAVTMSPDRAPGWYPDASVPGYERWWDGGSWSHVTRPSPNAPAAQPAAPGAGTGGWGAPGGQVPQPPVGQPMGQPMGQQTGQQTGEPSAPQSPPWEQAGAGTPGTSWQAPSGTPYEQPGAQPAYGQPPQPGYPAYPQYPASPGGQYPAYPQGGPYGGAPLGKTTPDGVPLANQGLRLVARILDSILTGIVGVVLGWSQLQTAIQVIQDWAESLPTDGTASPDVTNQLLTDPELLGAIARYSVISALVAGVYTILLIRFKGATLGKMAVGVRVRPLDREGLPTWGQSVLRWVTSDLVSLIPQVGGLYSLLNALWCLWDGKRQCLHDKLPKTVVVRSR